MEEYEVNDKNWTKTWALLLDAPLPTEWMGDSNSDILPTSPFDPYRIRRQ